VSFFSVITARTPIKATALTFFFFEQNLTCRFTLKMGGVGWPQKSSPGNDAAPDACGWYWLILPAAPGSAYPKLGRRAGRIIHEEALLRARKRLAV
jgi:hypothetical protein